MSVAAISWSKLHNRSAHDLSLYGDFEMSNRDDTQLIFSLHKTVKENTTEQLEENLKKICEYVSSATEVIPIQRKILSRILNSKDENGRTALHYAAQKNKQDACELLYRYSKLSKKGFLEMAAETEQSQLDFYAEDKDGVTPLHLAAQGNKMSVEEKTSVGSEVDTRKDLKKYLNQKSCLSMMLEWSNARRIEDIRDKNGMNPLHWACQKNNAFAALKLLIHQDTGQQTQFRRSPRFRHSPIHSFPELLQRRASNNELLFQSEDGYNRTPLHTCAVHHANETACILLRMDAPLTARDKYGYIPLHYAVSEGNLDMCKAMLEAAHRKNGKEEVERLIEMTDWLSNTSLHMAAKKGYSQLVELLLEKGKKTLVSKINSKGNTALHLAAQIGCLKTTQLLTGAHIDIHQANSFKMTALHAAAKFNRFMIVEFLMKEGALANKQNCDEMTPLLLAACHGNADVMKYLIKETEQLMDEDIDDRTCLHLAVLANKAEAVEVILSHNDNKKLLNKTDRYGNTPLHLAASNGYYEVAKLLLDNEDGSIVIKNNEGKLPIHQAAKLGHTNVIEMFLEKFESQLHARDEQGNTPIITAAKHGQVSAVQCLVNNGAAVDERNCDKYTALSSCAFHDFSRCARILINAGARVDLAHDDLPSPLHVACKHGSPNMVNLLLKNGASVTLKNQQGKAALQLAVDHGHQNCAKAIMISSKWKAALRSSNLKCDNGVISTPLRQMIKTMPTIAELVFFRCTKITPNIGIEDKEYNIQFDFEFLDDDYTSSSWRSMIKEGEESMNIDVPPCYLENNTMDNTVQPYSADAKLLRQNHPLAIMAEKKHTKLLTHPMVHVLLKHKWMRFGRTIYYSLLIFYQAFLFFLTLYFLSLPPPYAVVIQGTGKNACFVSKQNVKQMWNQKNCECCQFGDSNVYHTSLGAVVILLASISLLKEVFQLVQSRMAYFKELDNYFELVSYSLALVVVINWTEKSAVTGVKENWQWGLASVCLLTAFVNMALFVRKLPSFGIYVIMVFDVLKTFSKFFITFLIFIFGFALFFYMLLQNQAVFQTWWQSMIKTTVMMIGELDFESLFYTEEEILECSHNTTGCKMSNTAVYFPEITYAFFSLFLIMMPIIVMNLLVGLAVDDIKLVQEQATRQKLALQIKLALDVEYMMPERLRRHVSIKTYTIYPNRYKKRNWLIRFLLEDDETMSAENITKSLRNNKEVRELVLEQHEEAQQNNRKIKSKLKELMKQTEELNKQILSLTQQIKDEV